MVNYYTQSDRCVIFARCEDISQEETMTINIHVEHVFPTHRKPLKPSLIHCSFCGQSQKQVRKIIAGPRVYICDECVKSCVEVLELDDNPDTADREE